MLHKYSTSFLSSPGVWYTLLTLNYIFLTFVALSLFFLLPRNSLKNPPVVWETWVSSLGWEDPLEEGMATHSSILAWRITMDRRSWRATVHGVAKSWTRLSDFTFTFHFHALEKEKATHSSVLAWRIPGTGEPGGLPCMWSQSRTQLKRLSSSSS